LLKSGEAGLLRGRLANQLRVAHEQEGRANERDQRTRQCYCREIEPAPKGGAAKLNVGIQPVALL
jgi:hypothetical protein